MPEEQQPPGGILGLHINDPVALYSASVGRWIMFYTAFPNDAVRPDGCDPAVNPIDCLDLKRHSVGWMVSTDDAESWLDRGILLESTDGVWSPGVVEVASEFRVYYMDATQPVELWRQRVDNQTMALVAGPQRVLHPGDRLTNVDVVFDGDRFLLAGNRNLASEIPVYESPDGINFDVAACWPDPVLSLPGIRLDGPNIVTVNPLSIISGFNEGHGSSSVVRFTFNHAGCGS